MHPELVVQKIRFLVADPVSLHQRRDGALDHGEQGLPELGKGPGPHKQKAEKPRLLPGEGEIAHAVKADQAVPAAGHHVALKLLRSQRGQGAPQLLHPGKGEIDRLRGAVQRLGQLLDIHGFIALLPQQLQGGAQDLFFCHLLFGGHGSGLRFDKLIYR